MSNGENLDGKNPIYTEEALKDKNCSKYKKFSDLYNNLNWNPHNLEANAKLIDSLEPNLLDLRIKHKIFDQTSTGGQLGDFLDDPFLSSIYGLKSVTNILSGIYVPYSKDEEKIREFLLIYRDFFEIFYFEQGYIAYGEDLKNAENKDFEEPVSISQTKLASRSKFRLYRFAGNESENKEFINVVSVLSGKVISIKKNRLIPITFNQGMNRIH